MSDAYSVLGISPGADEETIKKAYRQKCKQYHPDLHPNDPTAEDKFKEVQAAYTEIMRQRSGGGQSAPRQNSYTDSRSSQGSQQSYGYADPFGFGFGFDPFGFGSEDAGSYHTETHDTDESPELQAANHYISNGYYREALNVLDGIASSQRNARWHYYAALANQGLGNNIRAQSEARMAADMEPNNYVYQNLLERLQNPGSSYTTYQRQQSQPGSGFGFNGMCRCCMTAWLAQMFCSLLNCCCFGGRGGYYY
jgi:molecular chaperone DnaJ